MLTTEKILIETYKGFEIWHMGYMDRDQYIGQIYTSRASNDEEPVFAIEKADVDLENCKPLVDRIKSDIDVRVEKEN